MAVVSGFHAFPKTSAFIVFTKDISSKNVVPELKIKSNWGWWWRGGGETSFLAVYTPSQADHLKIY